MRLIQNKRTKTLLQRKGKKQSKLMKLHNWGSTYPGAGFGPPRGSLTSSAPPRLHRNVAGL